MKKSVPSTRDAVYRPRLVAVAHFKIYTGREIMPDWGSDGVRIGVTWFDGVGRLGKRLLILIAEI
jgi:hypothetical protein